MESTESFVSWRSSAGISLVPTEIIVKIGKNFSGKDLVKFSMMSKDIYELMKKERKESYRENEKNKYKSMNIKELRIYFVYDKDDNEKRIMMRKSKMLRRLCDGYLHCINCKEKFSIKKLPEELSEYFNSGVLHGMVKTGDFTCLDCVARITMGYV